MAVRAPLVIGTDGELQELQSGDKLPNTAVNEAILPLFYGGMVLERIAGALYTPGAGYVSFNIRDSDGHLILINSSGVQTDLSLGGGSPAVQSPGAVFGDGVNVGSIPVGTPVYVTLPYSGSILNAHINADVACSVAIDLWKVNGPIANTLPTIIDTITGGNPIGLTSEVYHQEVIFMGWTDFTITYGDIVAFVITSLTGSPKQITITLEVI